MVRPAVPPPALRPVAPPPEPPGVEPPLVRRRSLQAMAVGAAIALAPHVTMYSLAIAVIRFGIHIGDGYVALGGFLLIFQGGGAVTCIVLTVGFALLFFVRTLFYGVGIIAGAGIGAIIGVVLLHNLNLIF